MKKMKKRDRRRRFLLITLLLALGVILGICLAIHFGHKSDGLIKHSKDELQGRYDYLLSHVSPTNVHPYLRPVHFSIGRNFAACGTLVLNTNLTPYEIVTAAHLFSVTQTGSDYYDYHVLSSTGYVAHGHISGIVLDSIRFSDKREGIHDVAFCHIGDPSLISRTSQVLVSAESPFATAFRYGKISLVQATSITTGEKFKVVGQIVNDQNVPFFVMLYESLNGESGSGFLGSDGHLYILSGNVVVTPEMRKALEISDAFKYVTVLSAVNINW